MKLYYNPNSRAVITKWLLDECGVDYEIVPIDFEKREHKAPEFLFDERNDNWGIAAR